jgi:hypothetical protein
MPPTQLGATLTIAIGSSQSDSKSFPEHAAANGRKYPPLGEELIFSRA